MLIDEKKLLVGDIPPSLDFDRLETNRTLFLAGLMSIRSSNSGVVIVYVGSELLDVELKELS